jgi:Mrp family chromosome partitioning ATPase
MCEENKEQSCQTKGQTCSHNCSECSEKGGCHESLIAKTNSMSKIKKVIGVVSGKGGVGKSMVTSLLAVASMKANRRTAILDADVTGPSIPKSFGITEKASGDEKYIYPVTSSCGIKVMSANLLLDDDTKPILWRGPLIASMVKQFWTDTVWGDVDMMFIDCPPGTGDVPLTVFQSIPMDGIVIVTSPQDLVSLIVEKAVNMAKMMNVPILALVENMSYFECPTCHTRHYLFGESHAEEIAKKAGIETVVQLPIEPNLSKLVDQGDIESAEVSYLDQLFEKISK